MDLLSLRQRLREILVVVEANLIRSIEPNLLEDAKWLQAARNKVLASISVESSVAASYFNENHGPRRVVINSITTKLVLAVNMALEWLLGVIFYMEAENSPQEQQILQELSLIPYHLADKIAKARQRLGEVQPPPLDTKRPTTSSTDPQLGETWGALAEDGSFYSVTIAALPSATCPHYLITYEDGTEEQVERNRLGKIEAGLPAESSSPPVQRSPSQMNSPPQMQPAAASPPVQVKSNPVLPKRSIPPSLLMKRGARRPGSAEVSPKSPPEPEQSPAQFLTKLEPVPPTSPKLEPIPPASPKFDPVPPSTPKPNPTPSPTPSPGATPSTAQSSPTIARAAATASASGSPPPSPTLTHSLSSSASSTATSADLLSPAATCTTCGLVKPLRTCSRCARDFCIECSKRAKTDVLKHEFTKDGRFVACLACFAVLKQEASVQKKSRLALVANTAMISLPRQAQTRMPLTPEMTLADLGEKVMSKQGLPGQGWELRWANGRQAAPDRPLLELGPPLEFELIARTAPGTNLPVFPPACDPPRSSCSTTPRLWCRSCQCFYCAEHLKECQPAVHDTTVTDMTDLCSPCAEEHKNAATVFYCLTCSAGYCLNCKAEKHSDPSKKGHPLRVVYGLNYAAIPIVTPKLTRSRDTKPIETFYRHMSFPAKKNPAMVWDRVRGRTRVLAVASPDTSLLWLTRSTNSEPTKLQAHQSKKLVAFAMDKNLVAVFSQPDQLSLWDLDNLEEGLFGGGSMLALSGSFGPGQAGGLGFSSGKAGGLGFGASAPTPAAVAQSLAELSQLVYPSSSVTVANGSEFQTLVIHHPDVFLVSLSRLVRINSETGAMTETHFNLKDTGEILLCKVWADRLVVASAPVIFIWSFTEAKIVWQVRPDKTQIAFLTAAFAKDCLVATTNSASAISMASTLLLVWDFAFGIDLTVTEPVQITVKNNVLAVNIAKKRLFLGTNRGEIVCVQRRTTAVTYLNQAEEKTEDNQVLSDASIRRLKSHSNLVIATHQGGLVTCWDSAQPQAGKSSSPLFRHSLPRTHYGVTHIRFNETEFSLLGWSPINTCCFSWTKPCEWDLLADVPEPPLPPPLYQALAGHFAEESLSKVTGVESGSLSESEDGSGSAKSGGIRGLLRAGSQQARERRKKRAEKE